MPTVYLWIMFGAYVIGIIAKFIYLADNDYPRTVTYQPWQDAFGIAVQVALAIWLGSYLF